MKNKPKIKAVFLIACCCCLVVAFCFGIIVGWFSKRGSSSLHTKTFDDWNPDISPERIKENLRWYASTPSLAGTESSFSKGKFIMREWIEAGLTSVVDHEYNVLLSYPPKPPSFNKLTIRHMNGSVLLEFTSRPPVNLSREDSNLWTPYHAFSASATVTGKLVFVSSVYQMDMMQRTMNFSFEEKLILINSSYSPGKSVIKRAERVGAAGIIVFSDADGVPGDAIHRGSLAMQPGDILTQGYPALDYAVRLNISEAELPSLPILTVDKMTGMRLAEEFAQIPGHPNNSKYDVTLRVANSLERKDIHNICGKITGKTDRIVLVGSHRDAWVNGAVDPGGSTAILMELVTTFTKMRQQGWEPLRTLMFCSWDAEEFGMFGSIEFAEHHREILNRMAVAYVNIDSPVMGTEDLKIVGSPLLTDLIRKAASEVRHPTKAVSVLQNIEGLNRNRTKWKFRLGRPSANTDHAQFLFNLGIPSSFMMWKSKTSILYPVYHTSYDTFEYVQDHIDPNFKFHGAIAELHARMLFSLTSDVIIPFNVTSYAAELNIEIGEMALFIPALNNTEIQNILEIFLIKIKEHQTAAAEFDVLLSSVNLTDSFEVQNMNDRLIGLERAFIDPLFENGSVLVRHVVIGPSECGLLPLYPGISHALCKQEFLESKRDQIPSHILNDVLKEIARVIFAIERATQLLNLDHNF